MLAENPLLKEARNIVHGLDFSVPKSARARLSELVDEYSTDLEDEVPKTSSVSEVDVDVSDLVKALDCCCGCSDIENVLKIVDKKLMSVADSKEMLQQHSDAYTHACKDYAHSVVFDEELLEVALREKKVEIDEHKLRSLEETVSTVKSQKKVAQQKLKKHHVVLQYFLSACEVLNREEEKLLRLRELLRRLS